MQPENIEDICGGEVTALTLLPPRSDPSIVDSPTRGRLIQTSSFCLYKSQDPCDFSKTDRVAVEDGNPLLFLTVI